MFQVVEWFKASIYDENQGLPKQYYAHNIYMELFSFLTGIRLFPISWVDAINYLSYLPI